MVLKSVKMDRLEFETLVLERVIFARSTTEDIWTKESTKAFFCDKRYLQRAKTASGASR